MTVPVKLDSIDIRILNALQSDASQSVAVIAEDVALSQNACWRRIKRLEDEGVIKKRVALLDAVKLGVGVTVFVTVRTGEHSDSWSKHFSTAVAGMPEIVEFYRLSGDADYLLKVQIPDIHAYDVFYKRLIQAAKLTDVSSAFAMEEIKQTTALPLPQIL
ncbi:MAG: Lrp/AsnC family transcriptional regulator [Rhizomicrobium sp.]